MTTTPRPRYEVAAGFLQITDPRGHRHFLACGRDLPDWVTDEQAAELEQSGAVYRFEMI